MLHRPRAPFQGAADEGGWGLYQICNCIVLSVKYQFRYNPHRFAEPPERGHGAFRIDIAFSRPPWYDDTKGGDCDDSSCDHVEVPGR